MADFSFLIPAFAAPVARQLITSCKDQISNIWQKIKGHKTNSTIQLENQTKQLENQTKQLENQTKQLENQTKLQSIQSLTNIGTLLSKRRELDIQEYQFEQRHKNEIEMEYLRSNLKIEELKQMSNFKNGGFSYETGGFSRAISLNNSKLTVIFDTAVQYLLSNTPLIRHELEDNFMIPLLSAFDQQLQDFSIKDYIQPINHVLDVKSTAQKMNFCKDEFNKRSVIIVNAICSGKYIEIWATYSGVTDDQLIISNTNNFLVEQDIKNICLAKFDVTFLKQIKEQALQKPEVRTVLLQEMIEFIANTSLQLLIDKYLCIKNLHSTPTANLLYEKKFVNHSLFGEESLKVMMNNYSIQYSKLFEEVKQNNETNRLSFIKEFSKKYF